MPKTKLQKAEEKAGVQKEDIQRVATSIFKTDLTEEQVMQTLEEIPVEAKADPTGDWVLWTEHILDGILN